MPSLPGEIRLYEPKQALDGGEDGFLVYRRLIPQALTFLKPGGWLLLEMGEGQAGAISALLWQAGGFGEIEVWRDYQGMDRVICAQRGRSRVG
jgi:release factor glutamine methyltransferase